MFNSVLETDPIKLFKLLLIGLTGAYTPWAIIFSFLIFFEVMPINFNEIPYYGIAGLGMHTILMISIIIMGSVFLWFTLLFGLAIIRGFLKIIGKYPVHKQV
ncbi:MAG: hypothetical protein RLN90_10710 [Balneolaceae bacterium]